MAYAFIGATAANLNDGDGNHNGPTPDIDTTGANLIVIGLHFSGFQEAAEGSFFTDTFGNTYEWFPSGGGLPNTYAVATLFFCLNPIVGPGHHWDLVNKDRMGAAVEVYAFSGAPASLVKDTVTNSIGSGPLVTTVPVTPVSPDELFISVLAIGANTLGGYNNADIAFVDSDFIKAVQAPGGHGYVGGATAYKIQAGQSTEQPTWTWSTIDTAGDAILAAFKPSPPIVTLGAGTPILEVLGRRTVPAT